MSIPQARRQEQSHGEIVEGEKEEKALVLGGGEDILQQVGGRRVVGGDQQGKAVNEGAFG